MEVAAVLRADEEMRMRNAKFTATAIRRIQREARDAV